MPTVVGLTFKEGSDMIFVTLFHKTVLLLILLDYVTMYTED
jgi:hypothetical protein